MTKVPGVRQITFAAQSLDFYFGDINISKIKILHSSVVRAKNIAEILAQTLRTQTLYSFCS
jgi:phosphohistidine phosphatase SixA